MDSKNNFLQTEEVMSNSYIRVSFSFGFNKDYSYSSRDSLQDGSQIEARLHSSGGRPLISMRLAFKMADEQGRPEREEKKKDSSRKHHEEGEMSRSRLQKKTKRKQKNQSRANSSSSNSSSRSRSPSRGDAVVTTMHCNFVNQYVLVYRSSWQKNRRREGSIQEALHPAKLAAAPRVPLNQIPQQKGQKGKRERRRKERRRAGGKKQTKLLALFNFQSYALQLVVARPRTSRQAGSLPTACQSRKRLIDNEGTITSPKFRGQYQANSSCTWIITPPKNANVSLRFTSFNFQSNSNQCGGNKCHCDFVQIKELDSTSSNAGFNVKYCNGNPPDKILYLMSRVRIRFVSDSTGEETGFKLHYKTLQTPAPAPTMGVVGTSVNQTVVTTTSTRIASEPPTNTGSSSNVNVSGFSIPLSTFTSKAPINSTAGIVFQVTPETRITTELTGARTPLPRTFRVTFGGGESAWTTPGHVVVAKEQKVVEEKVPDIVVLGPSIPVVMIFVLVVAGIAWWNYKFNSEEHNRPSPMVGGYKKISFAGRLLELAEGVRTPRPSRPSSCAEETVPLTKPSTSKGPYLSPGVASTGGGSRPSSRPASLLLRDALVNMFGEGRESEGQTPGSGSPSKRTSKRVSFIDEEAGQPLVQHETSPPEQIEEVHNEPVEDDNIKEEPDDTVKPARILQIPAILVRQPSEDIDFAMESPSRTSSFHKDEDPVLVEESPDLQAAMPEQAADHEPKGNEGNNGSPWNDFGENYTDSSSEDIPDRSLIFPDLEDFLLNLDKDSDLDEPPYSCASHIGDILRKSYGDEGLSGLGPDTVLDVPEGK
ncbi:Tolloid-like protein 2 [Stylophora pistillata]|uniref:Tolloid-like protein 2 n=1 Tax=Stylophora pistillata TaxID=50429 RepID=A0A2B4SLN7_STYPI|nr:Tolloid-like protein 2 [Stylophora pistillata]